MTEYFDFTFQTIENLKKHPTITSLVLVIIFIYAFFKIIGYLGNSTGLVTLTQRNQFIKNIKMFILVFICISLLNAIASLISNNSFSIRQFLIFINNYIVDGKPITNESLEYAVIVEKLLKSFYWVLFSLIFIKYILAKMQREELEHGYSHIFVFFFHFAIIVLCMWGGAIIIITVGTCKENEILFAALLAFFQCLLCLQINSSYKLGYAEYKLVYLKEGSSDKKAYAFIYSVTDDLHLFECGTALSHKTNSVIKIIPLNEILERKMKIQPTYIQEFREYFRFKWRLENTIYHIRHANEKNIAVFTNPLDAKISYAKIEIRHYKKGTFRQLLPSTRAFEPEYITIENWGPHSSKYKSFTPQKRDDSYITLFMAECESD